MKKGINKKGQETVGLGTMIIILVAVIGLIAVVWFITSSWGRINKITELAPEDRTYYAQACGALVNSEDLYCDNFNVIKSGKKTEYMNCAYMYTNFQLTIDGALNCTARTPATKYCTYLNNTKVVTATVNKTVNGADCTVSGLIPAEVPATPSVP